MKRLRILLVILLTAMLLGSCAPADNGAGKNGTDITANTPTDTSTDTPAGTSIPGATAPETTAPASTVQTPPEPPPDPVKQEIADMTLDEKIGQLLFLGFEGTELDAQTTAVIEKYKPGGIIIMGENVKSVSQLRSLMNSLKDETAKNAVPAFFGADQEGGRVSRMPPGIDAVPSAMRVGKTGNSGIAGSVGGILAEEVETFGFNMDFAPVLDIWSNPKNTVIGDRSYGTDPGTAGDMGTAVMEGIASEKIIPVVKHFPGHGDTTVDSHKELPVSENSLERLQSFELKPFAAAIADGADAVMVAHILLPKVDDKNPASLSKAFITDILRNQMGFGGVVITDDMTMGAISKNYGLAEAAVTSFQAGSDMILVAHGHDEGIAVAEALKNAAESGEISVDRLDESVYRILKLKEKYNVENEPVGAVNVKKLNSDIARVIENIP